MSYPNYFATYATMDESTGANPLWHACVILSEQASLTAPIRATKAIGFYSQPCSASNPLIKGIKQMIGLGVDLQDGHGALREELMRDLDHGGTSGISFAINAEQATRFTQLYQEQIASEQQAIYELTRALRRRGRPAHGGTRYTTENVLAANEQRIPRLKPFHITLTLSNQGLDSRGSHACKNMALQLLLDTHIIDEETRLQITGNAASHAFPRYSHRLQPMRLVSTGDPRLQVSQSKHRHYNRIWTDKNTADKNITDKNKLYWTCRPITFSQMLSEEEQEQYEQRLLFISNMLARAQEIEQQLYKKRDALSGVPKHREQQLHLNSQLARLQTLYDTFSIAHKNQQPLYLSNALLRAERVLNVAELSLTPERVNSSFLLRAYESVCVRNALLCMLGFMIAAICLPGAVGLIWMSIAALSAGKQVYGFFKEETRFTRMRADYVASCPSLAGKTTAIPEDPFFSTHLTTHLKRE